MSEEDVTQPPEDRAVQEIPVALGGAFPVPEEEKLSKRLKIEEAIETAAPTFPRVPFHLYHQMNGITVNLRDIEDAVSMDWGLRKSILRHANSSFYGGAEVDSIHQAVLRIGMNEFKNVIFQYGIQSGLDNISFKGADENFWRHSVIVGRLTVRFHLCYHDTPAPGYAAGLLHDIGRIFMGQVLPQDARLVQQLVDRNQYSEDQAERAVFGMHHEHVSALLCRKWGVAELVATAIENHYQPDSLQLSPEQSILSSCLAVANSIATKIQDRIDALEIFDFDDLSWCKYADFMKKYTPLRAFKIEPAKEVQLIRRALSSMKSSMSTESTTSVDDYIEESP